MIILNIGVFLICLGLCYVAGFISGKHKKK